MESFEIRFQPSVEKDFRSLPKEVATRVMSRISALRNNPFPPGAIKLSGTARHYRIRVGDYRIVYDVDTAAKILTIHYVRHRKTVYRGL
jgi:mRNA interferase RelE/StbE